MTLRGTGPETYITEYTLVYEENTCFESAWGRLAQGGCTRGAPSGFGVKSNLIYFGVLGAKNGPKKRTFLTKIQQMNAKMDATKISRYSKSPCRFISRAIEFLITRRQA